MLESRQFVIRRDTQSLRHRPRFDIFAPERSCEPVGTIIARPTRFTGFLPRFFPPSWRPWVLDIREKPDDSLVFTLHGNRLWSSWVEVRDSLEALIGRFPTRSVATSEPLFLRNAKRCVVATMEREPGENRYQIRASEMERELACVEITSELRLEFAEELDDQPLAKMLILGAALWQFAITS